MERRPKFQSIECVVKDVGRVEMGSLLESAIKFFLFQRTQIPVPFESLHEKSPRPAEEEGDQEKGQAQGPPPYPSSSPEGDGMLAEIENESENPLLRIRLMVLYICLSIYLHL